MFQLHDKVVYPGHGVAVIEEIIEKSVAGKSLKFFKLRFIYKDMTILIPVEGANQSLAIRPLCTPSEVALAMAELYKKPLRILESFDFTPSSWNKRNKEYQLKIQSGNLFSIASIYRDLMYIARQKELSFGEKNLLHSIEELISQEVQIILNEKKETIIQSLRKPFQEHSTFSAKVDVSRAGTAAL